MNLYINNAQSWFIGLKFIEMELHLTDGSVMVFTQLYGVLSMLKQRTTSTG